jgi:cytochrome c551/c552
MKQLLLIIGVLVIGTVSVIASQQGEMIFKSQGCVSCHRPASSSKVNPSLSEIAQAYKGRPDRLADYLKGVSEPIVRPERARMMERYLEKTRMLSDEERKAVAEFIMGHQG